MSKRLPDFSNKNILVIGDLMLDQYIYGSVNRISPEAPVPVMLREKTVLKAGGAANVALNLQSLGARPVLLGAIGNDLSGQKLIDVLEEQGINTEYIVRSDLELTTVKTRLIAGTQHLARIDEEEDVPVGEIVESRLMDEITNIIEAQKIDAILIEDYDKGVMTPGVINHIRIIAEERNLFLAVDPKKRNFLLYQDFDLLKPNLREVNAVLNTKHEPNLNDLEIASDELFKKLEYKNLLITLGEHGIFAHDGVDSYHESAEKIDIVDVCGAGDAVVAMATLCLVSGLSLKETMTWSNKTGAEVCRHPGVVAIERKALEK
jgi:rfaE bifunctional protein kinase chain/domain